MDIFKQVRRFFLWLIASVVPKSISGLVVRVVLIVALIIAIVWFTGKTADAPEVITDTLPTVRVSLAGSLSSTASTELIGTVKARNEAQVETETAGRVVRVNTELGDTVTAGQILLQLENASEAASVLQAEGAYDSAVAAAAQGDLGVPQAQNNVRSAELEITTIENNVRDLYRTSYTTANQILLEQIDDFFENPIRLTPRLKIDPRTHSNYFESERIAFRVLFDEWRTDTLALSSFSDINNLLDDNEARTIRLRAMVDILLELLPRQEANTFFTEEEINAAQTTFTSAYNSLNVILKNIENTRTELATAGQKLDSANESLLQARIGGTNNDISAANAQVKQALGSLRSAQAAYSKTIVRSPINGQVNKIDANPGDFLGAFTPVATIANNNALEITTFVGENDRELIALEQKVKIEGTLDGIITNIAPAIDPDTKKIEVKIATEDEAVQNGDTVTISISSDASAVNTRLMVPLTAVKFTETDGVIYTVEDDTLIANPVELGDISGSFVEIVSGIDSSTMIVIDARGRAAGQRVEGINN